MNVIVKSACVGCMLLWALSVSAEKRDDSDILVRHTSKGLEYRIKAGFGIGGTSPIPLPAEIRKIEGYRPGMQIAIEGNVIKWFYQHKWGALLGVRLENKGMKTDARVKNYYIVMESNDGEKIGHIEGNWTGYVKTNVKNSYVTLPFQVIYKISPRWDLKFGPYISFLTNGEFSGSAYDGYIRDGSPVGEKSNVTEATYDFSGDLRRFQWGADLGGEWRAYRHLSVYTDFTWGLNSIFPGDFKSVSFKMYNVYLNFGFGYVF